ncbi:MAG: hypothetical protein AAGD07_24150 [Planctomycetota bacterium]
MKTLTELLLVAGLLCLVGCGGGGGGTVMDGASEDDVAEYNRMLQESQDEMADTEKAMAEGGLQP